MGIDNTHCKIIDLTFQKGMIVMNIELSLIKEIASMW